MGNSIVTKLKTYLFIFSALLTHLVLSQKQMETYLDGELIKKYEINSSSDINFLVIRREVF